MQSPAPKLARGLAVQNDLGQTTDKVDGIWTAVSSGVQEVRYASEVMQGDMKHIERSLYRAREENLGYFENFSSRLNQLERSTRNQQVGEIILQLLPQVCWILLCFLHTLHGSPLVVSTRFQSWSPVHTNHRTPWNSRILTELLGGSSGQQS